MDPETSQTKPASGAADAALMAAAVGVLAMGAITLANELKVFVAPTLFRPAGGVSGRTTLAVVVWLIVWVVLHRAWRSSEREGSRTILLALVFIGLGVLMALPPVWHMFGK